MTQVFDASVVVKTLTEEPMSAEAIALLAHEVDAIAPDIIKLEVASALSKKGRYFGLPRAMIDRALDALPDMLADMPSSEPLFTAAMSISLELHHAFYDCLYLALAEARNCALVTADIKFATAVRSSPYAHRLVMLGVAGE